MLLLQSQLRRVFVPASDSYGTLWSRGSHPLLDPLWGTEMLEIVHDGCEADRPQKMAVVARSDVALQNLRVCNKQHATYNCGDCEKCVRTMVDLRLVDALDRCPTFPDVLDLRRVARMKVPHHVRAFSQENLRLACARRDWALALALAVAIRPRPLLPLRHRLGDLRRRRPTAARVSPDPGPTR